MLENLIEGIKLLQKVTHLEISYRRKNPDFHISFPAPIELPHIEELFLSSLGFKLTREPKRAQSIPAFKIVSIQYKCPTEKIKENVAYKLSNMFAKLAKNDFRLAAPLILIGTCKKVLKKDLKYIKTTFCKEKDIALTVAERKELI